jgi:23S rRNA (adenine2503-C2)-methyltransferase
MINKIKQKIQDKKGMSTLEFVICMLIFVMVTAFIVDLFIVTYKHYEVSANCTKAARVLAIQGGLDNELPENYPGGASNYMTNREFKTYLDELATQVQGDVGDFKVYIGYSYIDNYDNVIKFLKLVSDENGLNIGMRHISLSTSGIVPRIYDLLDLNLQLTLSVSLHAPNNEIRSKIMPVNNKWDVDELLDACKTYADKTSRRISFEYAMIKGVNDTPECAKELSERLKGFLCHVNLIPANEVPEKGHERSDDSNINAFKGILEKNGLAVTIRRTLGSDINASCGQLRREKIAETR